jgi:MFS family permease
MAVSSDRDVHSSNSLDDNRSAASVRVKRLISDHPFVEVISTPGACRILLFWLLAFMPVGMNSLASVLTLREYRYSYADAGAMVGAYMVGMAATSPFVGRLMDRAGHARVLIPSAVAYAGGVGLLVVLASHHAPLATLYPASAITGVAFPRVTAALRASWPNLMPSAELRDHAYLVQATLSEAGPIVGAALVAVLATTIAPVAALIASASFAVAGTFGFIMSPAAHRPTVPRVRRPRRGAFGITGIWPLAVVSAAMGGTVGAIEVAAPAFTGAYGSPALAGLALSASGVGSMLGGIVLASRFDRLPLPKRYRLAVVAFFAAFCLPLLAHSSLALIILLFAAGAPFALAYGAVGSLVNVISPEGSRTEAFSITSSAMSAGAALGVAAAGFSASHGGPAAALGVTAGFAAVAVVTAVPPMQRWCGLELA